MAKYIYVAQMDIPPELEGEFNRIYDTQHVPDILKVKGVRSCNRYVLESATVEGFPKYAAVYDIDSPEVVKSPEWRAAADKGDWKPKIRPHTFNRKHAIYRKLG
ncbi:MAG: hypothetical protein A3J29_02190 [Acidobacteria bacterium RIFCSPLOWO2_12_FULL_67_14b]|nr:MAG: hypothetical protein A3J29_02190 [Acidobacteria bacterium RIFCSPLOWO2_12_FULL_67_14b]